MIYTAGIGAIAVIMKINETEVFSKNRYRGFLDAINGFGISVFSDTSNTCQYAYLSCFII